MKKVFWGIALFLFILTGCSTYEKEEEDDGMIWDFVNLSVPILVTDADGNNLLDKESPDNILENDIKAIYRDETYQRLSFEQSAVRFNMPEPLGLRTTVRKYSNDKTMIILTFGGFSPESNHHNESFTIYWGDGTSDIIKFDFYIIWENKKNPQVHSKFYLNDQEWNKGGPITIVK